MANSGKPAQIFIVEDNDPDVFLVEEALRSQRVPAQIRRCQDGEEAIQALSQIDAEHLPDVIIIDLNLPKITGLDILKHVRSLKQLDGVPVLILTSSQSKADRALSLQLGANAYVAKPPTLQEFLSTVGSGIRGLLERSSDGEPGARQRPKPCHDRRTRLRFRASQAVTRSLTGRVTRMRAIEIPPRSL
jgi:chemotaxis family two-component system response regulator Rcp1